MWYHKDQYNYKIIVIIFVVAVFLFLRDMGNSYICGRISSGRASELQILYNREVILI